MANKQLTAKVRLNTSQAERSIDNLVRKINQMNNALNKTSNNRVEQQLKRSNTQVNSIANRVRTWANNQRQVLSHTRSTNSALGGIGSKLKHIAATYLGIMGAKAVMKTSDTITSAQNKLNYVNGSQLGSAGYTSDGKGYSNATINATAESMDKMYASAQKVRMGYDNMMKNVSKSMVLAGDSFGGNIDNAIRFQEIMAEAYSIGGAEAGEMSSSMYQLIQALGAGTLAGDELRSVREGASLAYDEIEKFVQGVYNSEKSLKDLASEGKVTADMVVAAVMDMGSRMDKAFAMTKQTFAQTGTQIKNAAIKAFEPVSNKLRDMLNKAIDNGLIEKVEKIFTAIAGVVLWILDVIEYAITWIADNWSWLQYVVLGVILVIIGHLILWTLETIANALIRIAMYVMEYWWLLLIVAVIVLLIWTFLQWKNAAIDTCEALVLGLLVIAGAILIIGAVTGNVFLLIIGIIIAIAALIFLKLAEVCGALNVAKVWIQNVWWTICNTFIAAIEWAKAVGHNAIADIVNWVMGLESACDAVGANVEALWYNTWNGVKSAFWDFIADVLEGLSFLEGPLNAIASLAGAPQISISGLSSGIRERGTYTPKKATSVMGAFYSGLGTMEYKDPLKAWKSGGTTFDTWADGWKDKAYNEGYKWGLSKQKALNAWGAQFQTGGGDFGILDLINVLFGMDMKDMFGSDNPGGGDPNINLEISGQPSPEDLLNGVDNLNKGVGGIGKDTGSMADAMDLAEEDLKYLRDLADREWKKEFTTANITVDMSNYNTINGENDLDGIVTKLADKLYEEMNSLADGVYA